MKTDPRRITRLNPVPPAPGPVIYWMSRDQRVDDNWALVYAQQCALEKEAPLVVAFCLVPGFLGATLRQYAFMLAGLQEVDAALRRKHVPLVLLTGPPIIELPRLVRSVRAGLLVTDFDPLRPKQEWRETIARNLETAVHEVDAHNIVPCRLASPKQEYGARTLRPKIQALLPEFLTEIPKIRPHPFLTPRRAGATHWAAILRTLDLDRSIAPVDWLVPGPAAGKRRLARFIDDKLAHYIEDAGNPTIDGQSDLSPYLHFGQLSAQRVALDVEQSGATLPARRAFLEQLIVRRELSDNFCLHNPHYDDPKCFPDWATATLAAHEDDERLLVYSRDDLEAACSHDPLWNAAQMQLVKRGKMHGYLRMYWAKKILEWTPSVEDAMDAAIYINDRYELDGRDPNGYASIAWSLGGIHDRPWPERPVFGKIRCMTYNGCSSKFNVPAYINTVSRYR